jgi:RNA polymerase sigma-70 factor (ECF subfamily)
MQADEIDAFEAFFERYRTPIYRTAYALTGDRGAAEEILQDTFNRAHIHRASLRAGTSPLPWLHRVCLNLCYSRLRGRRLRWEPISQAIVQLVRDLSGEPPELAERRELLEIVRAGVASLPPKHQSVVALHYLHDLSLQETADALGVPTGTVKSRLHYALRALRLQLEDDRRFAGIYRRHRSEVEAGR